MQTIFQKKLCINRITPYRNLQNAYEDARSEHSNHYHNNHNNDSNQVGRSNTPHHAGNSISICYAFAFFTCWPTLAPFTFTFKLFCCPRVLFSRSKCWPCLVEKEWRQEMFDFHPTVKTMATHLRRQRQEHSLESKTKSIRKKALCGLTTHVDDSSGR